METNQNNIVAFPVDKLIAPSCFMVKYNVGETVYFISKGFPIEGLVSGYFAHITPDQNLEQFEIEGGAKPASISNVGYQVIFFAPLPEGGFTKRVELLDGSELYGSFEELVEKWKSLLLSLPKK